MKKLRLSLLVTLIICIVGVSATPVLADSSTINAKFNGADNTIIVSGEIADVQYCGEMLMIRFIYLGEDKNSSLDDVEILIDFVETYTESGKVKFVFDTIHLPDLRGGTYNFIVSGESLATPLVYELEYSSPSEVKAAIDAMDAATKDTVYDVLKANIDILGLDKDLFAKVGADGKAVFSAVMMSADYSDKAQEGDDVREANKTVLDKLVKVYEKAVGAGSFLSIKDSTDVNKWLTNYYTALGFDDSEEANAVTPFLTTVKHGTDFTERIISATGTEMLKGTDNDEFTPVQVSDKVFANIKTYLYESALLSTIKECTDSEVTDVFEKHSSYFVGLKLSDYRSLLEIQQNQVIAYLSGTSYATTADVVTAFNDKVYEIANADKDNDSHSGGGGFRAPSPGMVETPTKTPMDEPKDTPTEDKAFDDIASVDWAVEAIEYLYDKGIVSGKASGVFAPNDAVTRAEFTKMAVEALGLAKDDVEIPFRDVANDSWYTPYVKAAYKAGVVNGDENGLFNPDARISREDMVTILYRAMGETDKATELDFIDVDSINDYAKDAVGYFSERGIVNGVGESRFAPKENATRAQTAVIIYRIIMSNI